MLFCVNPHKAFFSFNVGHGVFNGLRMGKARLAHGEHPADAIRDYCYIGSIWAPAKSNGNPSESQRYMNYTDSDRWCNFCFVFSSRLCGLTWARGVMYQELEKQGSPGKSFSFFVAAGQIRPPNHSNDQYLFCLVVFYGSAYVHWIFIIYVLPRTDHFYSFQSLILLQKYGFVLVRESTY